MQLLGHPHMGRYPPHHWVLGNIGVVIAREEHLDPGENQEGRKDIEHPIGLLDQRRTRRDHRPTQYDHCDDAPQQRAVLELGRNREEGENQADHEDIVDRQRLLDEEPGVVLHPQFGAAFDPDPGSECHCNRDVEGREFQRLADPHLAVLLVEDAEIESGQRNDQAEEAQPEPQRRAEPVGGQEFHSNYLCFKNAKKAGASRKGSTGRKSGS